MVNFRGFIKENTMSLASAKHGDVSIEEDDVRDHINVALAMATAGKFLTPYIALQNVEKVLAANHIFIGKHPFLEGESGSAVFDIDQFGQKTGMTDDGDVVTSTKSEFTVYFEYRTTICGMYSIFCEIVNEEELDEILEDLEAELNDDDDDDDEETLDEACWDGYKKVGMKKKGNRSVPDCVAVDEAESKDTNKKKKKIVMIRQANAKPEVANDGKAISRIRKAMYRPTVNQFDIRNLKIAEDTEETNTK
jgi:hypothetical protein